MGTLMLMVTLQLIDPSRGWKNTPSCFMQQKPKISNGVTGHLAQVQTLSLPCSSMCHQQTCQISKHILCQAEHG